MASASSSPCKPGCLGFAPALPEAALLLQKANQFAAQGVIVGVLHHLQALARPGQGHLENLADTGLRAVGEHHDPIGEQQGLIHIVGDHHRGDTSLLADLHQLLLEIAPGEGIQGTKRLIQQQQLGPDREGPGYGNPLLHATGEFGRAFIRRRAESHQLDVGLHNRGAFLPAGIRHDGIHSQGNVLANALPGQQRVVLEHHHAIGTRIGDLAAVHQDAALAGLGQARHQVEQGGFTTAGVADQRNKFTVFDLQINILNGNIVTAIGQSKTLGNIINGQKSCHFNASFH